MLKKEVQELINKGEMLPLMEEFYTIQGEGSHTGTAAYFIRIGGCDVGCHWCDVKESWDANLHPPTNTDVIITNAKKWAKTVVITGGEPLMWSLDYITNQLQDKGMKTHIETSGAYPFSGKWDWFCLSPKKTKLPTKECYKEADELKMIIHNKSDFEFAEEQAEKVGKKCQLFLQPEWSKKEKMTPLIVDYVMKNPKWRVSLQTHKYLNIP
ncbi:7-carboxy-7-deazaguanine synthase QueE [Tenacibaculum soleae]|uniref:7-carboxy-7-deazaguanine synthase n=1 Tax=Tenacibaculum soleae TaxID=447689 RepID=A0A1B9XXW1_9FLAO|nr:7-carboxy-7-deazaguanine synthase QueE [Tenacibaculum soleae]MDO6744487.1 7-carboxy-7-deazaguanine synthase QueE [Tenacibaculum soleae]MDO6813416.1 7-carboxy-7-deazaguanine synthase QueE [Tenacibaculum soleae]OCK42400.1 7-carboxy-7-deazaguanine synthase QueE [Tenacibaculum soleae]